MHRSKFTPKKTPVSWSEECIEGVPPRRILAHECNDTFYKCDFFFLDCSNQKGPRPKEVTLVKREWGDRGVIQYHSFIVKYEFVKDLVVAYAEKCLTKLDIAKIKKIGLDYFAA